MSNNTFDTIIAFFIVIAFLFLYNLLLSFPMMWLWNSCLVGAVNGVNRIEWFQAFGISMLFSFLFKTTTSKASN